MRGRFGWDVVRVHAAALVAASVLVGPAAAAELYAGGSAGQADVRAQVVLHSPVPGGLGDSSQYDFDRHHTGWKVFAGVRPISLLGAELEYIDFGHRGVATASHGLPLQADVSMRAPAVFAVGYLPLPVPLLDVFGKVGAAALHTELNATNVGHYACASSTAPCSALAWLPATQHIDRTVTDLAYGAGVRVALKPSALAVQLEYERVSQRGGDPDLLSLGVTYSF
ncbi:MAG TPA: outer membrane beta-barrel protein [Steroidobacteraceae bacterium]|nr:outer membrane beta-barrel protein [Steroidobacteraceae bacterium]